MKGSTVPKNTPRGTSRPKHPKTEEDSLFSPPAIEDDAILLEYVAGLSNVGFVVVRPGDV